MQLVYICPEYPGCVANYGGIGVALQQEAEWYAAHGHDVQIVCETAEAAAGTRFVNGLSVHVLSPSRIPKAGALLSRYRVAKFAGQLMDNKVGVVIAADYDGPLIFKPFKQPFVVQFHGCASLNAQYRKARRHPQQRWLERRTVLLASAIRAVSKYSGNGTLAALGVRGRTPIIIPNPIDVDRFYPNPAAVDSNLILFVGKLNEIKGAHLLPAIAKPLLRQFPQARFEIVGQDTFTDGQSFGKLIMSQVPAELQSRFLMRGRLARSTVQLLLARAAVVLMPSLSEACPLVAMEAMASGRPLVASRRGGIPEVVGDGDTGALADPDRPATFVDRLSELLKTPALAHKMGFAGRHYVLSHHRPHRIYEILEGLYQKQINYKRT